MLHFTRIIPTDTFDERIEIRLDAGEGTRVIELTTDAFTPQQVDSLDAKKHVWIELSASHLLEPLPRWVVKRASFGRAMKCLQCANVWYSQLADQYRESARAEAILQRYAEVRPEVEALADRKRELESWLESAEAKVALYKEQEILNWEQTRAVHRDAIDRLVEIRRNLEERNGAAELREAIRAELAQK